jgi:hypothetical protein
MVVITHQAVSVDLKTEPFVGIGECLEKVRVVGIIMEDQLAAASAVHDMIEGVFVFQALGSWHVKRVEVTKSKFNT